MKAFAALCLGILGSVSAQRYDFTDVKIPVNKSLNMLYVYFIFSQEESPVPSAHKPVVRFEGLKAHSTSLTRTDESLAGYSGLQVSIMRYNDFWNLIDRRSLCSTDADVEAGFSKIKDHLIVQRPIGESFADVFVYKHDISFAPPSTNYVSKEIDKSGVYILVFSNCGNLDVHEAVVSGSVVVKNPYGQLPGNEYFKMPFYWWLGLVYLLLAVIWGLLCVRWWNEIFNFHICIASVLMFGLVECFLWYVYYADWNGSGHRSHFLFGSSVLFAITKTTTSYMLVLVASLGWSVTVAQLDAKVLCRIQLLSVVYIILNFVREIVLSFRHSHSLPLAFVFLCLLPVSLMNGGIFYWVFTALTGLMDTLNAKGQSEKLLLFQRLWCILVISLTLAALTLFVQVFAFSRNATVLWKDQWLLTDGIPHAIFMFVLVAMMFLWAPHKDSQRYAYSQQIGGCEDGVLGSMGGPDHPDGSIWTDEVGMDDSENVDSFWASTHKGPQSGGTVAPSVFGTNG